MECVKKTWGYTKDKIEILLYKLKNNNGLELTVTNYGAIVVSLIVLDKNGNKKDVVLGFDNLEDYFINEPNFGATIGRNANRIKDSEFNLNGIEYHLEKNENNNCLHSGTNGYHKRVWDTKIDDNSITFIYHSPDMDQGFPGNLNISVTYTLTNDNELIIDYATLSDKDTIVNLTNHSYFNLSSESDILNHEVWINSNYFTPVNNELIPTGEIMNVKDTPYDFTVPKKIGKDIENEHSQLLVGNGYDHNFILNKEDNNFSKVASLYSDESKILMEVFTDLPGLQFYTGNYLNNISGKNNKKYNKRSGVCFETQYFPNAINVEKFKSPIVKAGQIYKTRTSYKFYTKA